MAMTPLPAESGIVWLASYYKSGNTWFRTFLSNLLGGGTIPVSIDALTIPWGISRQHIDRFICLDSSLLDSSELEEFWPDITRQYVATEPGPHILKTHAAMLQVPSNKFLTTGSTAGAIYLIRNPLDVCISFSHHLNMGIDATIDVMMNEKRAISGTLKNWRAAVPERISSWRTNVLSWLDNADMPTLVLRYEDILQSPQTLFRQAVDFLGLEYNDSQIAQAIEFSSFSQLQAQEQQSGFREKSPRTRQFFREGKQGGWRHQLNADQLQRLVDANGDVMDRLGYRIPTSADLIR